MARALTAKTVESIRPGDTRCEIPDAILPGLYLVVQPSGAKSWAVRYRSNGRTRKHTLGAFPAIDLKTARALAGKALRAAAEGKAVAQARPEKQAAPAADSSAGAAATAPVAGGNAAAAAIPGCSREKRSSAAGNRPR